jgi:hypothetical protein
MDWKERMMELSKEFRLTDHEVSDIIRNEYGITVSDESVRYYTRRKDKKLLSKENDKSNGISRTLVLNDLHIPFHREETIIDIILKHRDNINTIVFGGDIIDCEAISVYPKVQRKSLIQEMEYTYKFLKRVDRLTPNIKKILIWGNHEYRFVRFLAEKGSQLSTLHSDNIIEEIVGGFTHYDRETKIKKVFKPLSDNFVVINNWFCQIGDTIIAHPKNFSKVNMKTAVNAVSYFIAQGFIFSAILVAHTHKAGTAFTFKKYAVETGCLCKSMEYSASGNINYTPQNYGYFLLEQENGVIDKNNSKQFILDLDDNLGEWEETEVD